MDIDSMKAVGDLLENLCVNFNETYEKCQPTLTNSEAARASNSEVIKIIQENVLLLEKRFEKMMDEMESTSSSDIDQNSSNESVDGEIVVDVVSNKNPPLSLFDSIVNGTISAKTLTETNWMDSSSSTDNNTETPISEESSTSVIADEKTTKIKSKKLKKRQHKDHHKNKSKKNKSYRKSKKRSKKTSKDSKIKYQVSLDVNNKKIVILERVPNSESS